MPAGYTAGFVNTLRYGSYLVLSTCTVYSTGAPTNFKTPVSSVEVTVTRNAQTRRTATLTAEVLPTMPPTLLMPVNPSSPLAPFGNEIKVRTGIAPAGEVDKVVWTPLGLFVIGSSTASDTTVNTVYTLNLYDRSWVIAQRLFKAPYNVPALTGNFVVEIKQLLKKVWGGTPPLRFQIAPTTAKVPRAIFNAGSNPWTAAQQLAMAVGYELFFNATGTVVGYPTPTPSSATAVWNFTDTPDLVAGNVGTPGTNSETLYGDAYSTPVQCSITMTRDQIYNDVVVTGAGPYTAPSSGTTATTAGYGTAPVVGEARTTTASSPMNVTGPVGDIPEFVSSNFVTASTQASTAAKNYLNASLSDAWQVSISCPPNPVFDIDNVITVTRPRLNLTMTKIVIDTITHRLSYATLTIVTGRVVTR